MLLAKTSLVHPPELHTVMAPLNFELTMADDWGSGSIPIGLHLATATIGDGCKVDVVGAGSALGFTFKTEKGYENWTVPLADLILAVLAASGQRGE
jgi:hypothetical protein